YVYLLIDLLLHLLGYLSLSYSLDFFLSPLAEHLANPSRANPLSTNLTGFVPHLVLHLSTLLLPTLPPSKLRDPHHHTTLQRQHPRITLRAAPLPCSLPSQLTDHLTYLYNTGNSAASTASHVSKRGCVGGSSIT